MKKIIILLLLYPLLNICCNNDDSNPPVVSTNSVVYIDPSVFASGNGTLETPYTYWSDVFFEAGKTYAQKRGTIAREELIIDASGTSENPITIGAYGTGDAPIIQGSELESGWTSVSGNIYSKVFDSSCILGMAAEDGVALTFIAWDTDVATTFASASAGSFSADHNTNTLYVWCTDNASPDLHQMEVSRRLRGIAGQGISYVIIQDIKVQYVSLVGIDIGACGILSNCAGGEACSNVTIKNCTVTKCGGIWFGDPYYYHLGNGIQFANGATNCRVENCIVTDIFDSGVSPQIYSDGQSQSGIVITGTTIERCGFAGIEIAGLNNLGTSGSISNVTIDNVAVSGSGKGWSGDRSDEYPDVQAIGIKIAADDGSDLSDISIDQTSVTDCVGNAIWMYGDVGTVNINRSNISGNDDIGIAAMDDSITTLTLQLVLTSSLIYNNGSNGLLFDVKNGQGYKLFNNTFYNNGTIQLLVNNNDGAALVKNNIFAAPDNAQLAHVFCANPAAGIEYNYNCYYGTCTVGLIGYGGTSYANLSDFQNDTVHEDNGIMTDPVFTNASSGDFSLQSGSLCIGAGDAAAGIISDYSGDSFKNPPSIGAFEYY